MATKDKKRAYGEMSISELTEKERLEYIEQLEDERDNSVFELEELMRAASKLMGKRSLRKRKYKLGKAPNDRGA